LKNNRPGVINAGFTVNTFLMANPSACYLLAWLLFLITIKTATGRRRLALAEKAGGRSSRDVDGGCFVRWFGRLGLVLVEKLPFVGCSGGSRPPAMIFHLLYNTSSFHYQQHFHFHISIIHLWQMCTLHPLAIIFIF